MENDIVIAIITFVLLTLVFLWAFLCDYIRVRRVRALGGENASNDEGKTDSKPST